MKDIQIYGHQLDDYHVLSKLKDNDGTESWWLFTLEKPIIDGVVNIDSSSKEIWHMELIDPNSFEWNGERMEVNVWKDGR